MLVLPVTWWQANIKCICCLSPTFLTTNTKLTPADSRRTPRLPLTPQTEYFLLLHIHVKRFNYCFGTDLITCHHRQSKECLQNKTVIFFLKELSQWSVRWRAACIRLHTSNSLLPPVTARVAKLARTSLFCDTNFIVLNFMSQYSRYISYQSTLSWGNYIWTLRCRCREVGAGIQMPCWSCVLASVKMTLFASWVVNI